MPTSQLLMLKQTDKTRVLEIEIEDTRREGDRTSKKRARR